MDDEQRGCCIAFVLVVIVIVVGVAVMWGFGASLLLLASRLFGG